MAITCTPTDISRESAGLYLPAEVSNEIWGLTRAESGIMSAARHISIPGSGIAFPVVTGTAAADWVGETCAKPVGEASFNTKIMRPYKLAVIEIFSEEFARDHHGLYRELARQLPSALAAKFDATVLGRYTAPGNDFDTLAGAPTVNLAGGTGVQGLLAAQRQVAAAGGRISAWLAEPPLESVLLAAAVTGGWQNPFTPGEPGVGNVLGARVYPLAPGTLPAPFTGVAGDFADNAIYGTVGRIHVSRSDQASVVLHDGQTVNLWQQNMFALRAEVEVGFILRNPAAFVRIQGEPVDAAGAAGEIAEMHVNHAIVDNETVQRETVGNATVGNATVGNVTHEPAAHADGPFTKPRSRK